MSSLKREKNHPDLTQVTQGLNWEGGSYKLFQENLPLSLYDSGIKYLFENWGHLLQKSFEKFELVPLIGLGLRRFNLCFLLVFRKLRKYLQNPLNIKFHLETFFFCYVLRPGKNLINIVIFIEECCSPLLFAWLLDTGEQFIFIFSRCNVNSEYTLGKIQY